MNPYQKSNRNTVRYLRIMLAFVIGIGIGYAISFISGVHPSATPIISATMGLFIAFAIPIWQVYYLNSPHLSVEISSIKRTVADSATIIIEDQPELSVLKPLLNNKVLPWIYMSADEPKDPPRSKTISDLEELLIRAKQQIRDLPAQIEERRKEQDKVMSLKPTDFTRFDCDRLNQPLSPEIRFDADNKEKTLEMLVESYRERLEKLEKRYAELQTNLPIAERKIEQIRTEFINNRSFFTVSVSLINSGRTNTAIKVPALLRVYVGEGNYIDLKLTLKDFENKSEISANGTRIVVFESTEISSLPEDDRRLINTYWGQSVSSRLYIEDIHSLPFKSNSIAFAEGLYQKIIYDRLSQAASLVNKQ